MGSLAKARQIAFQAAIKKTSADSGVTTLAAYTEQPATIMGLRFPNRLGIAAGFDTTGKLGRAAGSLGFGSIELGTWSAEQWPNNDIRPSAACRIPAVLGISLGVPGVGCPDEATRRLLPLITKVWQLADYISIRPYWLNQRVTFRHLHNSLSAIAKHQCEMTKATGKRLPVIFKIVVTPGDDRLRDIAPYLATMEIDGIAVAFDTGKPATPETRKIWDNPDAHKHVCKELEYCRSMLDSKAALIAIGGVSQYWHYRDRLHAGADLVQLHNALVFSGPAIAHQILAGYASALR